MRVFLLNKTVWNYGVVKSFFRIVTYEHKEFCLSIDASIDLFFFFFALDKNLFRKIKQIKILPLNDLS